MSGYIPIAVSTSAWRKPFSAKRCASAACSVARRYGPRKRVSVNTPNPSNIPVLKITNTPSHGCSRKTALRNTGAHGASKNASVEGVFRN